MIDSSIKSKIRLQEIQILKEELNDTDYIALKSYEGLDTSQYGDWKSYRQNLRNMINMFLDMTDDEYEKYIFQK